MYVFAAVTWLGPHFHVNTPGAATLVPVCLRLLSICTHLSLHWSRNTTTADLKWPQADQTDRPEGGGLFLPTFFCLTLFPRAHIYPINKQCNAMQWKLASNCDPFLSNIYFWNFTLEWIISPQRLITIDMMYIYIYSILWLIFSSGHLIKIFLTCVI